MHFSCVVILQTQGPFVKSYVTLFLSHRGRPMSGEEDASTRDVGGKAAAWANWACVRLSASQEVAW